MTCNPGRDHGPSIDKVDAAVVIVDQALRSYFPDSYFRRCMYAAKALEHVLQKMGFVSYVCGGSFEGTMVRKDGAHTQGGFKSNGNIPGHWWNLTSNGLLVDLGLHYLPIERDLSGRANAPFVIWPASEPEREYCRHVESVRCVPGAKFTDARFNDKIDGLLDLCDKLRSKSQPLNKRPWVMSGHQSVIERAQRGDYWARVAVKAAPY